jgi:ketosteroid isomerase-like protein
MKTPQSRSEFHRDDLLRRWACRHSMAGTEGELDTLDDLGAAVWVQAYDAAWLGKDWATLEKFFATDAAVVLPGFSATVVGRAPILDHLRAMFTGAQVHEYNATDLKGHSSGAVGVIYYRWQLDWTVDGKRREISGRDILVLRSMSESWLLVWRAQIRA